MTLRMTCLCDSCSVGCYDDDVIVILLQDASLRRHIGGGSISSGERIGECKGAVQPASLQGRSNFTCFLLNCSYVSICPILAIHMQTELCRPESTNQSKGIRKHLFKRLFVDELRSCYHILLSRVGEDGERTKTRDNTYSAK